MQGMDNGPWRGLGTLGWFFGVWVVMMAATRARSLLSPLLFTAGYLVTWAGAGVFVLAIAVAEHRN